MRPHRSYFLLALLSTLAFAGVAVAGGVEGGACSRADTLATLPLEDRGDLVAWEATKALVEAEGYEVTAGQLIRYQEAADAFGTDLQWATATHAALLALVGVEEERERVAAYCQDLLAGMSRVRPTRRSRMFNLVGNAKSALGDESGSIPAYLKAIETAAGPDSLHTLSNAYGNYALSLLTLGDTATALEATQHCIELTSTFEDPVARAYNNVWDYMTLANLYFNRANFDSAHANLARGVAAFYTFAPDYPRYERLGEFVWDVQFNFFMYDGEYAAAHRMVDSLRKVGASFADLAEAEWFAKQERYAEAIAVLDTIEEGNAKLERQRLQLLIDYARALGDETAVAKYALAKAERAEADKRNNQASFAALAAEHRERFAAQAAAKAEQHAAEIALLRSRQRLWMALTVGLLALASAIYAYRRYRRSDERSRKLSNIVLRQDEDLARVNAQLGAQLRALEEFNHLLSHDLREPLRSISGFAKLIGRRISAYPAVAEDFAFLTAGIDQLGALHVAVERYRKIKEQPPRYEDADLAAVARAIGEEVSAPYAGATVEVVVRARHDTIATVDLESFRIALAELIGNALIFSYAVPVVCVRVTLGRERVTIAVQDNGIGIDEQYGEHVFGVFKRLNRREEFGGAGMGLAIARVAAGRLSGTLSLAWSELGRGSRFELTFPYVPPARERRLVRGVFAAPTGRPAAA